MASLTGVDRILVVEIGSITTRAILFETVDGQYRFIAKGTAATTCGEPSNNIVTGVRAAVTHLQEITGRTFLDESLSVKIPCSSRGVGVDRLALTLSFGEPLRMAVFGLLEKVSLDSALRLAQSTYSNILETIALNAGCQLDDILNRITPVRPDLIIAAGGVNGGASKSVLSMMEEIGLACFLLPQSKRPTVLFAGNEAIQDEVISGLNRHTDVICVPNIRPRLDIEQREPAEAILARLFAQIQLDRITGLEEIGAWSGGEIIPTSYAFGRVVRFLSSLLSGKKGVMGIDLGANACTIAAANKKGMSLAVFPQLGLRSGITIMEDAKEIENILRYVTVDVSAEEVQEYVLNRALSPKLIPITDEDLDIEHAIARYQISNAVHKARSGFPSGLAAPGEKYLPYFEPILAAGSVIAQASNTAQSTLLLLDSLQPVGVTTLVLDQNQIASSVGAAAALSPLLAVQVMNTTSFLNLGTVIAPIFKVKPGELVLRLDVSIENGAETRYDIRQGTLRMLPIPFGQSARIRIHALNNADVGMGALGRGGSITVKGGVHGVIVDTRGRPFFYGKDRLKRAEFRKKWLADLGSR